MRFGSLFTGIGGIDLGLERAGMECEWQVEIDPFCQKVLAKHWPEVKRYGDIREVNWEEVDSPELICGGFPCQNIARCGRREGIAGKESGLWAEFYRAVRQLQPTWVLVENSTGLTSHGIDRICGDLASCGYDAEWDCLPAYAFGAPHIRDRIYLLAYSGSERYRAQEETVFAGWASSQLHGGWPRLPGIRRGDDGLPRAVDRRRVIGNAVVPQVAEWIGRRIVETQQEYA